MAVTIEDQAISAQEVEQSDALEYRCQIFIQALFLLYEKRCELEQRLQRNIVKAKAPALKPFTMVLMWIDADEIRHKHEGDSAVGGEQAPRPTAAEAHKKADESFQAFKLLIDQHKDKKAVLHDVAKFSQLESACLEPFDEAGADIVRTPDGKLKCQDTFYLSLGIQRSRTEDKIKNKGRRELLLDTWKDLVRHCEHIVVWHLNNDDRAAVMKSLRHKISKHNKHVSLGRNYIARWIKYLVDQGNGTAEGLTATSEPSTAKPVLSTAD